jgi:translation initiation factor IF-3
VQELGFVESQAKQDGRNMIMVIGPHRKPVTRASGGSHGDAETEPAAQSRPVPSPRSEAPSESAAQAAAGAAVEAPASTDG